MWKNWQPEFEVTNYFSRSYQLDVLTGKFKPITSFLKTKLKELFQCDNCDYYFYEGDFVGYGSGIYWSYENNQLKYQSDSSSSTFNLYLFYKYSDIKTLKFKNQQDKSIIFTVFKDWHNVTDNSQNSILINGTSVKVFSIYTDISYITELTSLPYDDADLGNYFALRLNVSLLGHAQLSFNYLTEFGIEDYNEPYYWDNKTWDPVNHLEFKSIVGYTNETLSATGNAISLPSGYTQDNRGAEVPNDWLNKIAKKIKISDAFRCNNKTLEMIAFNNNISSLGENKSGQYIFKPNGTKTQTYGQMNSSTITVNDVAYFGGTPAIYPLLFYENMTTLGEQSFRLTWDADKRSLSMKIYNSNGNLYTTKTQTILKDDRVVFYIRPEGTWNVSKEFPGVNLNKHKTVEAGRLSGTHGITATLTPSRIQIYSLSNSFENWDIDKYPPGSRLKTINSSSDRSKLIERIITPITFSSTNWSLSGVYDFAGTKKKYMAIGSLYLDSNSKYDWNQCSQFVGLNHSLGSFQMETVAVDAWAEYDGPFMQDPFRDCSALDPDKNDKRFNGRISCYVNSEFKEAPDGDYVAGGYIKGEFSAWPGSFPKYCGAFKGSEVKDANAGVAFFGYTSSKFLTYSNKIDDGGRKYDEDDNLINYYYQSNGFFDGIGAYYHNTTYKPFGFSIVIWRNGYLISELN